MLTIYRRHKKGCKHRAEGRKYRHCSSCPIWVDGTLAGVEIRESLKMRDWQRASEIAREWEANGRRAPEPKADPMSVKEACDKFIADGEARGLRATTLYKYRLLFRQLQDFAKTKGLRFICECDLDFLRDFRGSWPNRNMAARKKLEALRAFCRFAHESGWLATNPATKLKPPRIMDHPTMPLTRNEFTSLLTACDKYPDKLNSVRLRALVLLLRHSGLRITDAVTLPRDRITDGKLFLYTAKTGTPVYCPLPPFLLTAMEAIPTGNNYFFWTGASKPKSAVGNWQRALKRLFVLAEVPTGHAHRLRDTFAIELLLAGVPMERVSILLGHSSIRVTEKHYSPWVRARQDQLENDVRRTWGVPVEGTSEVHQETGRVN
jgi:integrase/recombinase XerD